MIYRNLFILYIVLYIKIGIIYSRHIDLNFIYYSFYDDENQFYRLLVKEFNNEYTVKNGLDISVEIEVLSPDISTNVIENYGSTIESYLTKKSTRYDIYYYYSAYSQKYGKHLEDLRKYLPEEYIKPFNEKILKEACYSKDNVLVGMVTYIIFFFYINYIFNLLLLVV